MHERWLFIHQSVYNFQKGTAQADEIVQLVLIEPTLSFIRYMRSHMEVIIHKLKAATTPENCD